MHAFDAAIDRDSPDLSRVRISQTETTSRIGGNRADTREQSRGTRRLITEGSRDCMADRKVAAAGTDMQNLIKLIQTHKDVISPKMLRLKR